MRHGSRLRREGYRRFTPGAFRRAPRHHDEPGSKRHKRATSLPSWFLLLWLALVYGRELLYLYGVDVQKKWYVITQCLPGAGEPRACPSNPAVDLLDASPGRLLAFTLLFLTQSALLWAGLSGRVPRRGWWPYFILQGAVLLAIGIVAQQVYVVFSLYLALTLGAIVMLQRTRDIVLVAGGFGIALAVAGIQAWPFSASEPRASALWSVSDALMLLLFAVAYLAMYVRQAQASRQVAEYAAQVEALTLLAERQRMARELHDTLAQGVVGLALQLETIDSLLDDAQAPRAQEIVRHALRRARTTLAEARGAIEGLRESREDVLAAVHDGIRAFTATTGIPCHAELESLALLSTPRQEQVAATIAEALCNVERHARATQVWVRVVLEDGLLHVDIRDDGVGFDPAAVAAQSGHYGLRGVRERTQLLDGQVAILSAPGEGTLLRLSIPAREALPGSVGGATGGQEVAAHVHE